MEYKYGQELPVEVEKQLDEYVERIKAIKWFKPSVDIKKEEVEKQVLVAMKAFGVEANVEYRKLSTPSDWNAASDAALGAAWDAAWDAASDAAWDAARDAARDAASDAALGAAWDAAWDAARDAAWDAASDAALDAARGAADVLALNLKAYKEKYPNGNFVNLIPLWEMGLYPVGVVNGKFVIYVPPVSQEFPTNLV